MYWDEELESSFGNSDDYSAHVIRETVGRPVGHHDFFPPSSLVTLASKEVADAMVELRRKLQAQLAPDVWAACAQPEKAFKLPPALPVVKEPESAFNVEMSAHHRKKEALLEQVQAALKGHHPELLKSLREQLFVADTVSV